MSLQTKFDAIPAPPSRCKTCLWYDQLDDKDKTFFEEKKTADRSKLWKACVDLGLDASYTSFREHLNNSHGSR